MWVVKKTVFMLKTFYPIPTVLDIYILSPTRSIFYPSPPCFPWEADLCWLTTAKLPCPLDSSWLRTLESTSRRSGQEERGATPGWATVGSLSQRYSPSLGRSFGSLQGSLPCPLKRPTIASLMGYRHHLLLDSLNFAHSFINSLFVNYPSWAYYLFLQ